jgi:hypothetical protein
MNSIILRTTACAAFLALAACGNSTSDRALSGAGIGAGVGAVGALTDKKQIDLGRPVWR